MSEALNDGYELGEQVARSFRDMIDFKNGFAAGLLGYYRPASDEKEEGEAYEDAREMPSFEDAVENAYDDSPLARKVFEALGAASSCWGNLEGAGVFDSTRAREIGDELMAYLTAREEAIRDEVRGPTLRRAHG